MWSLNKMRYITVCEWYNTIHAFFGVCDNLNGRLINKCQLMNNSAFPRWEDYSVIVDLSARMHPQCSYLIIKQGYFKMSSYSRCYKASVIVRYKRRSRLRRWSGMIIFNKGKMLCLGQIFLVHINDHEEMCQSSGFFHTKSKYLRTRSSWWLRNLSNCSW